MQIQQRRWTASKNLGFYYLFMNSLEKINISIVYFSNHMLTMIPNIICVND